MVPFQEGRDRSAGQCTELAHTIVAGKRSHRQCRRCSNVLGNEPGRGPTSQAGP